jgi:hypothetical protein
LPDGASRPDGIAGGGKPAPVVTGEERQVRNVYGVAAGTA